MNKLPITIILIILLIISCDYVDIGKVYAKEKINGYYDIITNNKYHTWYTTETYIDYNGNVKSHQVEHSEYLGTHFYDYFFTPEYKLILTGHTIKQHKNKIITIYVSKETYNKINSGDYYKLYDESGTKIHHNIKSKRIETNRHEYISGSYEWEVKESFNQKYLNEWALQRNKEDYFKKY